MKLTNWAGYEVEPPNGTLLAAVVNFTVPAVDCSDSRGQAPYYGSMWVGIGGFPDAGVTRADGTAWLEQAGVLVYCPKATAMPEYQPFWEVVPAGGVSTNRYHGAVIFTDAEGEASVKPGDHVQAQVFSPADSPDKGKGWYFGIVVNNGNGPISVWKHDESLPQGVYAGNTAEVVTECPAITKSKRTGFVDLGTVQYTFADYITGTLAQPSFVSIVKNPLNLGDPEGHLSVSVGAPYSTEDDPVADDSFNTYYSSNWWR